MQGFLISLASAVILAIGGAFAAPYVVDWNAWRGTFESEIGRALGLSVVIRGPIDAQILPAPHLVLRDVTLGDVVSTGGTVKELQAELSLGGLMRGDIEATGVKLVRPQMRLVLDSAGEVALPTGSGAPADFSIARLQVENGSLDLLDRASDRTLSFTDLDLKGEARSLSGPFRLDGEVEAGGARFGLRSSLGALNGAGTGRLRLMLDGLTTPFGVDLDGTLGFSGRKPRFEGRAALSRKGADALKAWQLSAQLRASPDVVAAENLELALGGASMPAQLSGSARLALGRAVGLEAVLNARSLDLDALSRSTDPDASPDDGSISPVQAFSRFLGLFSDLPAPQAASKVSLAVDQLALGGTLVHDAHADIAGGPEGWRIADAAAQLPGKATLRLSQVPMPPAAAGGNAAAQGGLSGQMAFAADDPTAFLRWAAPDAAREYVAALNGPVRLAAKFAATPGRMALSDMEGAFGQAKVSGTFAAGIGKTGAPTFDAGLSVEGFDLDPIVAALRHVAISTGGGADAKIAVTGANLSFAGQPMRALTLAATATGGSWRISQLAVEDLGGLNLKGAGWMENFSTEQRGELNLTISGGKADGLVPVARLVAGEETAKVLAKLAPIASPVSLTTASVWSEGGGRSVSADGTLGELTGAILFARTSAGVPLRMEIKAKAADAGRALAALGVDGLAPHLGGATGELTVDPLTDGQSAVKGRITLAGLALQGEGTARLGPDGVLAPRLSMRLDGGDLGRLLPQVAAAVDGPAPAALAFDLARTGTSWRMETLTGSLAGAPITGTLTLQPGPVPRLFGKLAFDALSLPRLVGLFGARAAPAEGGRIWSDGPFRPSAVEGIATDLELFADRLAVIGPYGVTGGQLRLVGDGASLEVRNLSGTFGGGQANARLTVRPLGEMVHAEGRLSLDDVEAAALARPTGARTPPTGKVSLTLDLGGSGRSVAALVETLAGQGTLRVSDLKVAAADPVALSAVLAQTDTLQNPPDERRTAALLDRALANGPLALSGAESTFGVVNGLARLSPARTQADGTLVTLSGSLDLLRLEMDAQIDFEGAEVAGGVPGGTVAWHGPVGDPDRRVGAATLTSVIALRAIERETKRLEERRGPSAGPGGSASRSPVTAPGAASGVPAGPGPGLRGTIPAPAQAPIQAPAPARTAIPTPTQIPVQPPIQAPAPAQARPAPAVQTPRSAPAPSPALAPSPAPAAGPALAPNPAPQAAPLFGAPVSPPTASQPPAASAPAATRATAPQQIVPQATAPQTTAPSGSAATPRVAPAPAAPPSQQSFGIGTAPSGGGTATPAARPGASTQGPARSTAPAEARPSRPPEPQRRAPPAEASTSRPAPARPAERRPPVEIVPPAPTPHLEPTLPPTQGFGDLPRPPGLVGGAQ